jgi:hypothetical protein
MLVKKQPGRPRFTPSPKFVNQSLDRADLMLITLATLVPKYGGEAFRAFHKENPAF